MKFEDLHLCVGDSLQVQFLNDECEEERYTIKLLGYNKDRSVIATTPMLHGKIIRMRPGQEFNIRLTSPRFMCAFRSYVETIHTQPYSYMHLGYPAAVEAIDYRKSVRVKVNLGVSLITKSLLEESGQCEASVADISISGARLQTNSQIGEIGDAVTLITNVTLADIKRELLITGILRSQKRINTTNDEHCNEYGIEFLPGDEENRLALYCYVYSQFADTFA